MPQHRIRRWTEVPSEYSDEARAKAAKLPQLWINEDLYVEYAISAPTFVGVEDEVSPDEALYYLRRQHCTAWVVQAGQAVGGIELKCFVVPTFMENEEFLGFMDADSAAESELSCALASEFESISEDVGAYGDIVELSRMWLSKLPALAGNSREIINALISAFCPEFSVIALKAFPLEYEGNLPEGSPTQRAFERRQAALMRYYKRILGVAPMQSD